MSDWAGIKKAINSDLDFPLNKLINKRSKLIYESPLLTYSECSDADETIFSIESPNGGLIQSIAFPVLMITGNNINTKFKVVCDGEEKIVIDRVYEGSKSNAQGDFFRIIDPNVLVHSGTGSDQIDISLGSYSTKYGYIDNTRVHKNTVISHSDNGAIYLYLIDRPIIFEKSFSIIAEGALGVSRYFYNGYSYNGIVSYALFD